MHFRLRKNVVQLVRNTYDPDSKRSVATVVARLPLSRPELTDEIRGLLTREEIGQLRDWIEARHRIETLREELAALQLPESLALAANWFEKCSESVATRSSAEQVVQSWQKLRAVLKARGYIA